MAGAVAASAVSQRAGVGLRSASVTSGAGVFERSLVERIIVGDDSALATAYDQFGAVVFGVALRLVGADHATDICQDVFITLWDHPERFDEGGGSLRAFLVTIARRRCIDHLRRGGRRAANEARAHRGDPLTVPDVDESALTLLTAQRLREALDHLPDRQREAIELAYFGGLSFREVAAATGATEGTAKSRIRLGLQRLATVLRQDEMVGPA